MQVVRVCIAFRVRAKIVFNSQIVECIGFIVPLIGAEIP